MAISQKFTYEEQKSHIILVIDKKGIVGSSLVSALEKNGGVIIVSNTVLSKKRQDVVVIPFVNKIPSIPNLSYSHIFLIYDKEIDYLYLEVLKKASSDKTKCTVVIPLFQFSKALAQKILVFSHTRIVVVGDLFDKHLSFSEGRVQELLIQVSEDKRVELVNSGLEKTYPVELHDAADAILHHGFSQTVSERVSLVLPEHPYTQLTIARIFKKADPDIAIDFKKQSLLHRTYDPEGIEGVAGLKEAYEVEERLKDAVRFVATQAVKKTVTKEKKKRYSSKPYFPPPLFLGCITLVLIFLMPLFVVGGSLFVGRVFGEHAKAALKQGDMYTAQQSTKSLLTMLSIAKKSADVVAYEARFIGQEEYVLKMTDEITKAEQIALFAGSLFDASSRFKNVLQGKSVIPQDEFTRGIWELKSALREYQHLSGGNQQKSLISLLGDSGISPHGFTTGMKLLGSSIDVLPTLFGFDQKRVYLVLFQNNMELRPGGGFIGSYGLLSLEKGKMSQFTIHDVYDADGQLKGHIEPPFQIRRYLPSVHWYLRDSNFDVDFVKNASSAAYFLNLETGEKVDGVIAVDVTFLKELVRSLGTVEVLDYNERVTENNVYTLTQKHAEKNFFPGSTQKKDFLRSLSNAVLAKIAEEKNISYPILVNTLVEAVLQKHVLFAFSDMTIQSLFTVNDFSSTLWDSRRQEKGVLNDYLGVNDANLGVNKANFFVKRKISHHVSLESIGTVRQRVSVTYKNSSKKNEWPGGDYKNYVRFIVPKGASLTRVEIDGVEQEIAPAITSSLEYEAKNFKAPEGLEVETTEQDEKTIFGMLVTIPADSFKTVSIEYSLPFALSLSDPTFTYDGKILKEPGTEDDIYSFSISYPKELKVIKKTSGVTSKGGKVSFETTLLTDLQTRIEFGRK